MKPRVLILRSAGTNCDEETAYAFELAGAQTQRVHLNRILEKPHGMADFQILAIPGGFSYGDDISSGKIFANQLRIHLADALAEFVAAGKPVIGICNGFQILVKAGLLPGPMDKPLQATLAHNDCHRFIDRWIHLKAVSEKCVWLKELRACGEQSRTVASCEPVLSNLEALRANTGGTSVPISPAFNSQLATVRPDSPQAHNSQLLPLPIAHGEGKFVPANEAARKALWDNDQVAFTYVRENGESPRGRFPDNPNGSVDDIAGICDSTGLVLGLMPHPERYVAAQQHPAWTSQTVLPQAGAGLAVFKSAVNYAAGKAF